MMVEKDGFDAGVFLIDKPVGASSFNMVAGLRRVLGIKKVGHAGTLDPFATGLLIICAGRKATRMISLFMDAEKEYIATLCLGIETETYDPEGEVVAEKEVGTITEEEIDQVLEQFKGQQMQVPPAYSALKHKGKPLYHYARKGIKIEKEARSITIYELEWLDRRKEISGKTAELRIRVKCSKGTYIRTIGHDIGRALGCGAYLTALRRTKIGCFSVENAVQGDTLRESDAHATVLSQMLTVEKVSNMLQ